MDEAMRIRCKSMPLDEEIKSRQGKGQPHLERRPSAMGHFLKMTDAMNHREDGLDQHARIPQAPITQFEIHRISLFGMERRVTEDDHYLFIDGNQRMESGIGRIGAGTIPADDQAPLIEQQTEFAPDNPAMIRFPFAPDLLLTASFAHRMEQLYAVAIDNPQERRSSQELICPGAVGGQQAKQSGPLGQGGKQGPPIPGQPPIKGPIANAFEGKENPHRNDFARPQVRQGMLGVLFHGFIYPIEQLADKIFGCHALFSLHCKGVATRSLGASHDAFQGPLKLAPLVTIPPTSLSYCRW